MNSEEIREAKKVLKKLKGDIWYLGDTTDRAIEIIRELCKEGKITKEELHQIEKNHRDILE